MLKDKKKDVSVMAVDDVFGAVDEPMDDDMFSDGEEPVEEMEVSKVEDPEEALGEIAEHLKMASDVIRRLGM